MRLLAATSHGEDEGYGHRHPETGEELLHAVNPQTHTVKEDESA